MPLLVPLFAGITARTCADIILSPAELIRTKMQTEKMSYAKISSVLRKELQSQGMWGLWSRGLRPTLMRDVPFSGIYWTCYESMKSYCGVTEPSCGFSFLSGAFSGWVSYFCLHFYVFMPQR